MIVAVEYDGNARRGLVARCRREDGSEYRIGLADVEMPARTPAARHAAAYRAWLGIVPDAGAPATTPRSLSGQIAGTRIDASALGLVPLARLAGDRDRRSSWRCLRSRRG